METFQNIITTVFSMLWNTEDSRTNILPGECSEIKLLWEGGMISKGMGITAGIRVWSRHNMGYFQVINFSGLLHNWHLFLSNVYFYEIQSTMWLWKEKYNCILGMFFVFTHAIYEGFTSAIVHLNSRNTKV